MEIISICNQKGGVGKTTLSFHVAYGLHELGNSILLIDLDPQGNLSILFGKDGCNILDVFTDKRLRPELVAGPSPEKGISLVSSNLQLAKAESKISYDSYTKLRKSLDTGIIDSNSIVYSLRFWDYCIIDCPPSLGLLTINAFIASHLILIPSLPAYFSLTGLRDLMEVVEEIREDSNPKLKVLGIVLNQFDRTVVSREAGNALSDKFPDLVFKTKIPKTVKIEESLQSRIPVWVYDPENVASIAFKEFLREFGSKL